MTPLELVALGFLGLVVLANFLAMFTTNFSEGILGLLTVSVPIVTIFTGNFVLGIISYVLMGLMICGGCNVMKSTDDSVEQCGGLIAIVCGILAILAIAI